MAQCFYANPRDTIEYPNGAVGYRPGMRKTIFSWGWGNYDPLPDPRMTRDRMARLMRAWRRSRTQGNRDFDFRLVKRGASERVYRVHTTRYFPVDSATIVIRTVP